MTEGIADKANGKWLPLHLVCACGYKMEGIVKPDKPDTLHCVQCHRVWRVAYAGRESESET